MKYDFLWPEKKEDVAKQLFIEGKVTVSEGKKPSDKLSCELAHGHKCAGIEVQLKLYISL